MPNAPRLLCAEKNTSVRALGFAFFRLNGAQRDGGKRFEIRKLRFRFDHEFRQRDILEKSMDKPIELSPHIERSAHAPSGTLVSVGLQARDGRQRALRQFENLAYVILFRRAGKFIAGPLPRRPLSSFFWTSIFKIIRDT